MSTQKISVVTGGAGFIGSHLCDLLVNHGYEVFCIDNLVTGSKKNVAHLAGNPKFHLVIHDITKPLPQVLLNQLNAVHYIYHLASVASPPQYRKYSIETLLVNSLGTYFTLELAKDTGAGYLLASTSEVYGNPAVHPQKETYFGYVNPVGLRACYDEGKRFAEAMTMEFVRKHKVNGRIIRIFNTYGPRMQKDDGRVISNFVNQAIENKPLTIYGKGTQTRSFCYVSDMVDGIFAAMENKNLAGEVINLGNPDEYDINYIAKVVIKLTGAISSMINNDERLGDDPDRRKPDITKAMEYLGWQPKINLEEGLVKTINYFKKI